MASEIVSEEQILEELHQLSPTKWSEILNFITFLKYQSQLEGTINNLTAAELLQSKLVGLWADRSDIGDSLSYARQLRQQAEHRGN
ncbi:hypothetical protein THIOM_003615 [Candidatus Thiomargarita nelsonii]|uniref:DUF2281 domain-containing protein n=1 Tax=Candidatus Thiomargarita nelsonii TaxID=1003181 RepID=A0A0A6NY28_9GAMM|nr:hypothetical protein THIOM_003615 [Candidatus Thiomargarita nelsonii]